MPKMKVVITGYYEIPDDLSQRKDCYDTTSIDECAKMDQDMGNHAPEELLGLCEENTISVNVTVDES